MSRITTILICNCLLVRVWFIKPRLVRYKKDTSEFRYHILCTFQAQYFLRSWKLPGTLKFMLILLFIRREYLYYQLCGKTHSALQTQLRCQLWKQYWWRIIVKGALCNPSRILNTILCKDKTVSLFLFNWYYCTHGTFSANLLDSVHKNNIV